MGCDSGEHFDWRQFIVVLAQPFPLPSPLDVVQAATSLAQVAPQGLVAWEDYMKVWCTGTSAKQHAYLTAAVLGSGHDCNCVGNVFSLCCVSNSQLLQLPVIHNDVGCVYPPCRLLCGWTQSKWGGPTTVQRH